MATQIQLRRGSTSQHNVFTGAIGEITVDTDKDTLVVHDGTTQGGYPLAKASEIPTTGALAALNSVGAAQIDTNAVGASELADNAVDTAAIANDAVTAAKIALNAVGSSEIAANAVGSSEIAANAVTDSKIVSMSSSKLSGALPAIDGSALTGVSSLTLGAEQWTPWESIDHGVPINIGRSIAGHSGMADVPAGCVITRSQGNNPPNSTQIRIGYKTLS